MPSSSCSNYDLEKWRRSDDRVDKSPHSEVAGWVDELNQTYKKWTLQQETTVRFPFLTKGVTFLTASQDVFLKTVTRIVP